MHLKEREKERERERDLCTQVYCIVTCVLQALPATPFYILMIIRAACVCVFVCVCVRACVCVCVRERGVLKAESKLLS